MFYDVDILNRRGGKFGIIWLVANQKIRLRGKGSKSDLRLMLKIDVDRICQDLMRYVRIEYPATLPGDSNPRFSLYLAAMLTHGAILVHHRQVCHTLARFRLTFQQRKAEKTLKENNISCNALDLTDIIVGPGENLLGDHLTLEEREFGQLVAVVDALTISAFQNSPPQVLPVAPLLLNQTTSADEIEKDFAEYFKQTSQSPNGNIVSPHEITMREEEPVVRTLHEPIDESFGIVRECIGNIPEWENNDLPPVLEPMDIDYPRGAGQSSLQRSNSKRAHNGCSFEEDIPSKQSRTDQPGDLVPEESNHTMDITLEPLRDLPIMTRRRRPRRLIVDTETFIPAQFFQQQLINFGDTLRVMDARDDSIIPQYAESTVKHLMRRPTASNIQSPLSGLCTRNMITRQVDGADFDVPLPEVNRMEDGSAQFEPTVAKVSATGSTGQISASSKTQTNEVHDEIPVAPFSEHIPYSDENLPVVDSNIEGVEKPLAGQSNEVSLIGSFNASSLIVRDNSGFEISRASPVERQIGRNPCMDTLVEASVENSRATKSAANEDGDGLGILIEKPLTEHAPATEQVPSRSTIIPTTTAQREILYSQVEVPGVEDLLNMIDAMTDRFSDTITFRELVPPSSSSRIEAAKIFSRLLVLQKESQIDMHQEPSTALPYADIHINLRNRE